MADGNSPSRARAVQKEPLNFAVRTARRAVFAGLVFSIGACAGPRKGAEAGPTSGGSTTSAATAPATGNSPTGAATSGPVTTLAASGKGAGQGQTCEDGKCAAGLTCVEYYGIAGGAGPKFTSCEIKCQTTGKSGCPTGQNCVVIADGPGAVCRPPDM